MGRGLLSRFTSDSELLLVATDAEQAYHEGVALVFELFPIVDPHRPALRFVEQPLPENGLLIFDEIVLIGGMAGEAPDDLEP